jgi:hypothetical protein
MTRTKAAPENSAPPSSRPAARPVLSSRRRAATMLLGNATVPRDPAGSDNRCGNAVHAAYLDLIGAPLATAYPECPRGRGRRI